MLIKATREQIQDALDRANEEFDGNLMFNNFTPVGRQYRVTLRVKDSHGLGARLGYYHTAKGNQRRLISACWHAHGTFFNNMPKGTSIRVTRLGIIYSGKPWQDRNIGSIMYPLYFSDACDC